MGFYLLSSAALYLSLGLVLGRWLLHAPGATTAAEPADQPLPAQPIPADELLITDTPALLDESEQPHAVAAETPPPQATEPFAETTLDAEPETAEPISEPTTVADPPPSPLVVSLTDDATTSSSNFSTSDLPAA